MRTLIKNGTVIDGTGKPSFKADLLIEEGFIVSLDKNINAKADRITDAGGCIVCPGFMDMHAHSDLEVLRDPSMHHKIAQGITFDLSGNCGVGVFPRRAGDRPAFADILGHYPNWTWTDFPSYTSLIHSAMNIGFLQSHGMLRMRAIEGNPNRRATSEEVQRMCALLDQALSQGCLGLSSGLYYAPNMYADEEEILALLRVVKKHNALFCVHHRCEGDFILSSVDEVINYAFKTDVKLEISHLKAIGTKNQKYIDPVLEKIHNARDRGLDIAFDQYPYEYGSTSLYSLLPPSMLQKSHEDLVLSLQRALSDPSYKKELTDCIEHPDGWDSVIELCGFDNISIAVLETNMQYRGLTLTRCAQKMGTDCYDALFTLLIEEKGSALMFDITQSTENLVKIMKDPLMCFGTDALYTGNVAHPRSSSAAVHILDEFCKQKKILSYEEMINRMTGRVAQRTGLTDRGILAEGKKADIVVFDPVELKDNSSTTDPYAEPSGIKEVFVNGQNAFESLSGEVARASQGYRNP